MFSPQKQITTQDVYRKSNLTVMFFLLFYLDTVIMTKKYAFMQSPNFYILNLICNLPVFFEYLHRSIKPAMNWGKKKSHLGHYWMWLFIINVCIKAEQQSCHVSSVTPGNHQTGHLELCDKTAGEKLHTCISAGKWTLFCCWVPETVHVVNNIRRK